MIFQNFLYYGADYKILSDKVSEKIKQLEIDDMGITSYSLFETELDEVVNELTTFSFLSPKKAIILTGINKLSSFSKNSISSFNQYLKNPNNDAYLFIIQEGDFDFSSETYKFINLYVQKEKLSNPTGKKLEDIILNIFKEENYNITEDAILELILRCQGDFLLIEKEIEKIKIYSIAHKQIDINIIKKLVIKNMDNTVFDLVSAFFENDKTKTIDIFYNLLTANVTPFTVLSVLFNRLKDILLTKYLLKDGKSQDDISTFFNISQNRVYYLIQDSKKVDIKFIESSIIELSNIDYQIKSGQVDPKVQLEIFLLGGKNA